MAGSSWSVTASSSRPVSSLMRPHAQNAVSMEVPHSVPGCTSLVPSTPASAGKSVKVAVTVVAAVIVTTQVPVPEQPPPDQPPNDEPPAATAVSTTTEPSV